MSMKIRRQLTFAALTERRLHPCHNRTTKCASEQSRILIGMKIAFDIDGKDAALDLRRHHSETEEAAVTQHEWPSNFAVKLDFDVPKRFLGKSRPFREALGTRATGFERFSLHVRPDQRTIEPSVSERLSDRMPSAPFFRASFRSRLGFFVLTAVPDAAPQR
jgi:hypothetical protein